MYSFVYSTKFKKDIKLCQKRSYDFQEFKVVLENLGKTGKLPAKYKPHTLSGNFKNHWECHIKPDWLLIWLQDDDVKEIILIRLELIVICFKNQSNSVVASESFCLV